MHHFSPRIDELTELSSSSLAAITDDLSMRQRARIVRTTRFDDVGDHRSIVPLLHWKLARIESAVPRVQPELCSDHARSDQLALEYLGVSAPSRRGPVASEPIGLSWSAREGWGPSTNKRHRSGRAAFVDDVS